MGTKRGLGLVITERFFEMMGGDITVTSKVGERSMFTVRLSVQISERVPA